MQYVLVVLEEVQVSSGAVVAEGVHADYLLPCFFEVLLA